jgi:hypothetical protein
VKRRPKSEIANWWFSDADLAEVASMIVDDPYHASVQRDLLEEEEMDEITEQEEDITHG